MKKAKWEKDVLLDADGKPIPEQSASPIKSGSVWSIAASAISSSTPKPKGEEEKKVEKSKKSSSSSDSSDHEDKAEKPESEKHSSSDEENLSYSHDYSDLEVESVM